MRNHDIPHYKVRRLVGVDPKTVRCERPLDHPGIRQKMKQIAGKRRRFGYRSIGVLPERKDMIMAHKKPCRPDREVGLSVKWR